MPYRLTILGLFALMAALVAGEVTPTYSIPSQNLFNHDFGVKCAGDVLALNVVADPGCTITANPPDNGSSAGWVGGPNYTAVIPANYSGVHLGKFSGTYTCPGPGGGGGSGAPPVWTGMAKTDVLRIISHTNAMAPDKTPDTRTIIAVCESVEFKVLPAQGMQWTATAGTPLTGSGSFFDWDAPHDPGSVTITATDPQGHSCTIKMEVIPPAEISARITLVIHPPPGKAGGGMKVVVTYLPTSVNFGKVDSMEGVSLPIGANGFWDLNGPHPAPPHDAAAGASNWVGINFNNQTLDTAASIPYAPPWSQGEYSWDIPRFYRCRDEEGGGKPYGSNIQNFTIDATGNVTVAKFGKTSTSPATPGAP